MKKFILLVLLLGLAGCSEKMQNCSVREISLRQGSEAETFCVLSCRTYGGSRTAGPRVDCKFYNASIVVH